MAGLKYLKTLDRLRNWYEKQALRLPLPRINPYFISALSLVLSVVFALVHSSGWRIILLFFVLATSWLDGPIARKHRPFFLGRNQPADWIVDTYVDRLSEGLISIFYFLPFFPLFIVNCYINSRSYKSRRYYTLPLRHLLLLYLVISIVVM